MSQKAKKKCKTCAACCVWAGSSNGKDGCKLHEARVKVYVPEIEEPDPYMDPWNS
jgi:hypothetical protein